MASEFIDGGDYFETRIPKQNEWAKLVSDYRTRIGHIQEVLSTSRYGKTTKEELRLRNDIAYYYQEIEKIIENHAEFFI